MLFFMMRFIMHEKLTVSAKETESSVDDNASDSNKDNSNNDKL